MQETEKIRYIVTPTFGKQLQVLQLLEDNGYLWTNGKLPTQRIPIENHSPKHQVIYIRETYKFDTKRIQTGRIDYIEKTNPSLIEVTIQELRYHFRPAKLLL